MKDRTKLAFLLLFGAVGLAVPDVAQAIPAWGRMYSVGCQKCHYPNPPRLSSYGEQFRRAGYRPPSDIGKAPSYKEIGNYVSMRARPRYDVKKTGNGPTENEFTLNDATMFYAGPITGNLQAFFEISYEDLDAVNFLATVGGTHGSEDGFLSWRFGQMHTLTRVGFGGLDRPTGISSPAFFATKLTGGVPFALGTDQRGVEVNYAWSKAKNRVFGQVLNGVDPTGDGSTGRDFDTDNGKDVAVGFSRIFDDIASGCSVVYYNGRLDEPYLDSAGAKQKARATFHRFVLSANKVFGPDIDLMGGYMRSGDRPDAVLGKDVDGNAFFVGAQKAWLEHHFTILGRFDWWDPSTDITKNNNDAVTAGFAWDPKQYVRLGFEYTYTHHQATDTNDHLARTEVMLNF